MAAVVEKAEVVMPLSTEAREELKKAAVGTCFNRAGFAVDCQ